MMKKKDRSRFIYPSSSFLCQCQCCDRGIRNWLYLIENNDENLAEKGIVYVYLECLEGKD